MLAWWILGGFLIALFAACAIRAARGFFSRIDDNDPPVFTVGAQLDPLQHWTARNNLPLRDPLATSAEPPKDESTPD